MVKTGPVAVAPAGSAPIFVDEREQISGETANELLQGIQQSLTRALPPSTVRLLYIEEATTTSKSIFSRLELPAPGVLLRNINGPSSVAGIVNVNGTQFPFFILSVASYGDTFAGMLSWEPRMTGDLAALFPLYPPSATITASTTKAKTTVASSTPIFSVFFHDEVVDNHDVRIYRDAEGRSVLIYGYWNQYTLVIARSPEAFIEILQRLATSRS